MNEDEILDESEEEEEKRKPGWLLKTVALVIILAFIAFSFPGFSYLFSDKLNFLKQNQGLMEDQIVERCKPAVVSIDAYPIDEALNNTVRKGTGFNISPTGMIVTNHHVVVDARVITITFGDGRKYYADRYETIPGVDLVTIKIAGNNLPTLTLDMKDQVKNGDTVTVIGNPLGFEKISQRGATGDFHTVEDNTIPVFDIKFPANPGSSGSPVINSQAQVVGVVYASTSMNINGKEESRALAIPILVLRNSVSG